MDRIWPGYAPGWPGYAPLLGLRADLPKKRFKSLENASFSRLVHFRRFSWICDRQMDVDGCGWIVFGLVTPQDGLVTPQDGLVTPQNGLVTPPLCRLRADLLKTRPKFVKIVKVASKYGFWGISYIFKRSPRMA